MRLINTSTLELKEFFDGRVPKYAILSHCWAEDEVSLQAFLAGNRDGGQGWEKITRCCEIAVSQRIEWAWIDTCCIDKTSSAELSEAINSMYRWYEEAVVCYAFLADVNVGATNQDEEAARNVEVIYRDLALSGSNNTVTVGLAGSDALHDELSRSRWFTRGWTLQELLAPAAIIFYDANFQQCGTKNSVSEILASITGIDECFLRREAPLSHASIACRMSWASSRETTRTEDIAYCLLGIFEANMPLLYGEGQKAFRRLQETIMTQSDDSSIFAWKSAVDEDRGMLAKSPSEYAHGKYIRRIASFRRGPVMSSPFEQTNRGIKIGATRWSGITRALRNADYISQGEMHQAPQPHVMSLVLDCEMAFPGETTSRGLIIPLCYRDQGGSLRRARPNHIYGGTAFDIGLHSVHLMGPIKTLFVDDQGPKTGAETRSAHSGLYDTIVRNRIWFVHAMLRVIPCFWLATLFLLFVDELNVAVVTVLWAFYSLSRPTTEGRSAFDVLALAFGLCAFFFIRDQVFMKHVFILLSMLMLSMISPYVLLPCLEFFIV